ncbi:MAG: 2-oxoacid:ferredoxin oxidoreductase subunit beta [Dehalococcoidia bacterium]|nr:2-oxoacid:ferredoxin oxidoreductase subunit beta [Dehalococcoidia bacterium]MSQ35233.1 2-oxoacid:ferredoxin oxidoreductase subunit beta [Dehalococcoidia bacterium]
MSARNEEYDFKWCPGCGDFGVRRALEWALEAYDAKHEQKHSMNVVVAGIGCSGNMVHLLEGEQPFGLHGIHGRTLPLAFGVKMARPELNTVVVAGDGDFLSIGGEHIAPQAARNLDIACVIMDNGVYGLTKGQSSPTTKFGVKTSSTPHGKIESEVFPLKLYMSLGVSFIASHYSSKPKELAKLIGQAMEHRGFAIVHVQSPCTTYNDNYDQLKGDPKKGIAPLVWDIPADHDPSSHQAAEDILNRPGIPIGIIYKGDAPSLEDRQNEIRSKVKARTPEQLLETYAL